MDLLTEDPAYHNVRQGHRVPLALLPKICHHLVPSPDIETLGVDLHTHGTDFRNLLLVCTTWRDIILQTSSLWTYVRPHTINPVALPEYLARSGHHPLNVHLHFPHAHNPDILGAIGNEANRIKSLSMTVDALRCLRQSDQEPVSSLRAIFQSGARALTETNVCLTSGEQFTRPVRLDLPLLFSSIPPSSRKLYLSSVTDWTGGPIQNLSEIFMKNCRVSQAMTLLQSNSSVRKLVLVDTMPGTLQWRGQQPLLMARLESLYIEDRCSYIHAFLSRFSIPSITRVHIRSKSPRPILLIPPSSLTGGTAHAMTSTAPNDVGPVSIHLAILAILPAKLSHIQPIELTVAMTIHAVDNDIVLDGWNGESEQTISILIQPVAESPRESHPAADAWPTLRLTTLRIDLGRFTLSFSAYLAMFRSLLRLRDLAIDGPPPVQLFQSLCWPRVTPLPCPELRCLRLHLTQEGIPLTSTAPLFGCVKARYREGHVFSKVLIVRPDRLKPPHYDVVRELVTALQPWVKEARAIRSIA